MFVYWTCFPDRIGININIFFKLGVWIALENNSVMIVSGQISIVSDGIRHLSVFKKKK